MTDRTPADLDPCPVSMGLPFRYIERQEGLCQWFSKAHKPTDLQGISITCCGYRLPQYYPFAVVLTPPVIPQEDTHE